MRKTIIAGLFVACILITGCGKVVPPGQTVIIRKPSGETKIVTKGVFKAWGRDRLYFVDNKLQSFVEDNMQILCQDDINMTVDVKSILSFEADKDSIDFIQAKVPATEIKHGEMTGWQLSLDQFYKMLVRPIVRAAARDVVSQYNTDDIRPNRQKIAADIDALVRAEMSNYPIFVDRVLISNIDYPLVVREQRNAIKNAQLEDERKAALANAAIAEAQRQVDVETEKAKVRMIKAQAQADENEILTQSLTPEFLMWRQFEVMEVTAAALADGNSNTVYMMPYSAINPDMLHASVITEGISNVGRSSNSEKN